MKIIAFIPILLCSAMLICSCSKSADEPVAPDLPDSPEQPVSPVQPEKIEIKINPSLTESRATDYGFETNDRIGLYVVNYNGSTAGTLANSGNHVDNMCFSYSGTWTPASPIYWADEETHADFYLYYPYTSVNSVNAHQVEVCADQSTEAAYKASDFMVGKATDVAPTADATVIPANHVMSRIIIDLQAGNGFTQESLAAADVAVKINGVKCNSTVDIATGKVSATGSATTVIPYFTDNTYRAIIVPQSVAEDKFITVTVDGTDYDLIKAFTFESATSHKFTVILEKISAGINVSINPWTEDGSDNGGTAE